MTRGRLLFISPRFLFPMNEGGKIRTANILRAMHGGTFEIILASPAPRDYQRYQNEIEAVCDEFVSWPEPDRSPIRRALGLLSSLPVGVWSDRSSQGRKVVEEALRRADGVVIDFPHSAVLLPPHFGLPSILFTHNVETEIFERHAKLSAGLWRLIWKSQALKMARYEAAVLARSHKVIAVSARDAAALRARFDVNDVETIDTGVDPVFFQPLSPTEADSRGGTVCFTGIMDSPANIDGVKFLMDEVWPSILEARPAARMLVIGRNPPKGLVAEAARRNLNWTFTGFVEDVRTWVAKAEVCVIPLRAGSGTRIKAFEALAMAKPLVSTRLGVEGLPVEDGLHFLAADTGPELAAAILRTLDDAGLRRSLGQAGRALIERRFSWATIGRQFEDICLRGIHRSLAGEELPNRPRPIDMNIVAPAA